MMKSKRVLILGGSGMLGTMMCDYFVTQTDFKIAFTYNNNPSNKLTWGDKTIESYALDVVANEAELYKNLETILSDFAPDYILNCIGLIKNYCNNPTDAEQTLRAIKINSNFPFILQKATSKISPAIKVIQIATDCVYDGLKGKYSEKEEHNALDVYGKTKSLGEVAASNFLNIRCSIIGPELSNKSSLLEWFLGNEDGAEIFGFEHHHWNGVTTLQFAKYCEEIILNDRFDDLLKLNHCLHYVVNESVSKYKLLNIFNASFQRDIKITSKNDPKNTVDRTISSSFLNLELAPMAKCIDELYEYTEKSNVFKNR